MEQSLFPYAIGVISALFALLVALLAFVGSQIKEEVKRLADEVALTNRTLAAIERDLRGELSSLDRRISIVESRCEANHTALHGGSSRHHAN